MKKLPSLIALMLLCFGCKTESDKKAEFLTSEISRIKYEVVNYNHLAWEVFMRNAGTKEGTDTLQDIASKSDSLAKYQQKLYDTLKVIKGWE